MVHPICSCMNSITGLFQFAMMEHKCTKCPGICKDGAPCNKSTGMCDNGCSMHMTGQFCEGAYV